MAVLVIALELFQPAGGFTLQLVVEFLADPPPTIIREPRAGVFPFEAKVISKALVLA